MMMTPDLKKLLKQTKQIDADRVEIISKNRKIVIEHPQVLQLKVMDQNVYQITGGNVKVEEILEFKEEDIKLIMEQTGKSKEEVLKKLKENNWDIAQTIVDLTD